MGAEPTQPVPERKRGEVQGPLHVTTETLKGLGLDLVAHLARVSRHCAHLQPITSSPERVSGLVGGGVERGLPALGLREAGLK